MSPRVSETVPTGAGGRPRSRSTSSSKLPCWKVAPMLSDMESSDAAAVLRDAEAARDAWAGSVVFPRLHDETIGAAVAVQIATTALGLAVDEAWAKLALAGGLVLFGVVAAIQLWRFARLNGVRVG